MPKLTSTQNKLLNLLRDRSSSFTLEELASMLDLANRSSVHYNLKELVKKGYLKVNPSNSTDYIVLDQRDNGLVYLPLFSGAKCGPDGKLVSDYAVSEIPIPSAILNFNVNVNTTLAIRTEGDSMEPKIPENSIVIVNRSESEYQPNETFLVVRENMPLIKNLYLDEALSCFVLSSYNPSYKPILTPKKDLTIIGKVRAVINNFS